jgi:hypothetical protein
VSTLSCFECSQYGGALRDFCIRAASLYQARSSASRGKARSRCFPNSPIGLPSGVGVGQVRRGRVRLCAARKALDLVHASKTIRSPTPCGTHKACDPLGTFEKVKFHESGICCPVTRCCQALPRSNCIQEGSRKPAITASASHPQSLLPDQVQNALSFEQMFRRPSACPHYNLLTSLFIWAIRSLS